MIDERHEELAALHALDLLEGAERAAFERELAARPELQALVRELRDASATLAHTAPALPAPAALKARLLASIDRAEAAPAAAAPDNVIRPSFAVWQALPWAAAACFGLCAIWFGQGYLAERSESAALRTREALAQVTVKTTQQQLEAERIVGTKRLEDSAQQLAAANTDLGAARTQLAARDQQVATLSERLATLGASSATLERQLADARSQLTEREQRVATLTQRIADLATSATTLERHLGESRQEALRLAADLKRQTDLAEFKITTLASMLKNSPQALAVAVWNPAKQEGVLQVDKLPALLANQDYQLWVVDPQYPNPVDGGVFTVNPQTGAQRISFKAKQPVASVAAFAVTLERKGGVPKAEGPFVLLGK
jgi:anti-sigma-K factor RskA